jgi:hypothetical protein
MAEKHNPLTSLPRTSVYATRINFAPATWWCITAKATLSLGLSIFIARSIRTAC